MTITYFESVFRKSLLENVEVFLTSRTIGTALTFVEIYADRYVLYLDTPYLSECGVLCRLFLVRSFHNLPIYKRNQLHTFFFITKINLLELRIIDIMKQLEKHLHEQYAINNNSKTTSMTAILAAVMIAFTAFAYVLYHSEHNVDLLLCASNAVIGVIVLLYIIATYLGTDQRKEQFISFAIRVKNYKKDSEYNSIYPKNYNPFNKTFCNFVQGLYNLLSVALVCCLIVVVITTICAKGCNVDCSLFHCCWGVSLMYMLYYRLKKYQEYLKLEQEYKDKYTLEENLVIKDILSRERPCCIKQFFSKCCKHFASIVFPVITMILSVLFFIIFRLQYPSDSILTITSVIFFFAGLYTMLIIINSDK